MVDLNKEIKLGDLFKRAPKERVAAADAAAEPDATAPAAEKTSPLKKEINLSFRRRPKSATDAVSDEPKPSKPRRERRSRSTAASPVPQVPLMRAFNLLPKEDPRAGGGRPSPAQLVLAVAALLLFAGLGCAFLLLSSDVSAKEQTANALRQQLAALDRPQEAPAGDDAVDQQLVDERTSRTGALATAIGSRVAWDRLLREVSLVLPDDVWLDTLTAQSPAAATTATATAPAAGSTAATTFTLTGYTYEQSSVAELLARLAIVPELSNVALASSARGEVGGKQVVQFSINAQVKPTGGGAA